ncbi:YegP family protein [Fundidesulfovibrio terrae]|uniref:YegP family protein n=1 Tax=Fundidesulfovibrio terrae TaxID=2922866 RepID=UPI001FB0044C|nr:hypothetical protein [Fundidesulfovibrio terrae]
MPGKITIVASDQELYRFRYQSQSGESILEGAPRPSKSRALEDADAFRRGVSEDGRYHVSRDLNGRFYFHFLGECGEELAVSAAYPTPEGLGQAIALLKACAPKAALDDRA